MSILNLNTPQGGNSGGKKKAKMWMGAGLLAAVLGVGSTLAANITLNSPAGNTEFGQGVTQTVYCGTGLSTSVQISPISTYTNANTKVKIITTYSATEYSAGGTSKATINSNSSSNFPKFDSLSSSKSGWWLEGSSPSTATFPASQPTIAQVLANPANYIFAEESSSGKYKKGTATTEYVIYTSDDSTSFKLAGIVISKIPEACSGIDFVVSSYSDSGTAQTMVSNSGATINIKELAALWLDSDAESITPSRSRYSAVSTSGLVTASRTASSNSTNNGTLSFIFVPGANGTLLSTKDLFKLVVETQEDVLS